MRIAWTGGFLHFNPIKFAVVNPPQISGNVTYFVPQSELWSFPARYRGFSVSSNRVILSYSLLAAGVLESPWFETNATSSAFTRSFQVDASSSPLNLILAIVPTNSRPMLRMLEGLQIAYYEDGGKVFAAAVRGAPEVKLGVSDNHFVVMFGPHDQKQLSKVFFTQCDLAGLDSFATLVKASANPEDLTALSKPGPSHWKTLNTVGEIAPSTEPYVVDTIPVPYDNPDKALMFLTGVDFFDNGDAAVCTLHGDVWTASGIDNTLQKIRWHRFATGLYQALGLKVIQNQIYVLGRDQITRLRDLNGDGEADLYESFYNGIQTSAERHHFVACLETDTAAIFTTSTRWDSTASLVMDNRE